MHKAKEKVALGLLADNIKRVKNKHIKKKHKIIFLKHKNT
jgi:hypothetical protein